MYELRLLISDRWIVASWGDDLARLGRLMDESSWPAVIHDRRTEGGSCEHCPQLAGGCVVCTPAKRGRCAECRDVPCTCRGNHAA